jgi:LysM repeat protein
MRRPSGISLMLLIFLSLSLITFSLLSLSGAVADEKLSQKAADRTTEYYKADTAANDLLSQIDHQLAAYLKQAEAADDPQNTYQTLCSRISESIPSVTWEDADSISDESHSNLTDSAAGGTISFIIPVNDTQELQASILVVYPAEDYDTLYRISSWKVVNTADWNPDTSQHVYQK